MSDSDESPIPYQVPQTIYVGDYGRLIYPLDGLFFSTGNTIIPIDTVTQNNEVLIHGIEIVNGNLIIDFQSWRTGIVYLPSIPLQEKVLEGVEVVVASLIEGKDNSVVLSPPVTPVNPPGTVFMISGTLAGILAVLAVVSFFMLRGGTVAATLMRTRRRRRAARAAYRNIRRIKNSVYKKTILKSSAVSDISAALREFLENFHRIHCRSLTGEEFLHLNFTPFEFHDKHYTSGYFSEFFSSCDTIRFSGADIPEETVIALIHEVEEFIRASRASYRNRTRQYAAPER